MIKTENIVPSNYYTRSRDFQLLGRVLDIVFNSSKGYSDMVQYDTICSNTDYRLLDLIAKAVGFEVKRKYDVHDLFVLCSTFKSIIRKKGTVSAVEDCVRVLLKAQNINKPFQVIDLDAYIDSNTKAYELEILVPEELTDIALLEDMLEYVLPAGYIYKIINTSAILGGIETDAASLYDVVDASKVYQNAELGHIYNINTENTDTERTDLSVIYDNPEGE